MSGRRGHVQLADPGAGAAAAAAEQVHDVLRPADLRPICAWAG
jgi:hypothetical protein